MRSAVHLPVSADHEPVLAVSKAIVAALDADMPRIGMSAYGACRKRQASRLSVGSKWQAVNAVSPGSTKCTRASDEEAGHSYLAIAKLGGSVVRRRNSQYDGSSPLTSPARDFFPIRILYDGGQSPAQIWKTPFERRTPPAITQRRRRGITACLGDDGNEMPVDSPRLPARRRYVESAGGETPGCRWPGIDLARDVWWVAPYATTSSPGV